MCLTHWPAESSESFSQPAKDRDSRKISPGKRCSIQLTLLSVSAVHDPQNNSSTLMWSGSPLATDLRFASLNSSKFRKSRRTSLHSLCSLRIFGRLSVFGWLLSKFSTVPHLTAWGQAACAKRAANTLLAASNSNMSRARLLFTRSSTLWSSSESFRLAMQLRMRMRSMATDAWPSSMRARRPFVSSVIGKSISRRRFTYGSSSGRVPSDSITGPFLPMVMMSMSLLSSTIVLCSSKQHQIRSKGIAHLSRMSSTPWDKSMAFRNDVLSGSSEMSVPRSCWRFAYAQTQ
mmetsp:Transcript_102145/g.264147  ORF Transcript_102145/g.264147 Transcript_102145/m.264147 type:complete len:289 (+) Transcript_102145:352-1218(+)